ncbi:hypothetical protein WA026_019327 [Henosepilachna vigintioctopunctata]|uniref:Uncharacterized protein n=1 Tax=Henosepilachna vigintioctopunctata TaxID=420089 RepID=A0AAW1UAC0_9CUCU
MEPEVMYVQGGRGSGKKDAGILISCDCSEGANNFKKVATAKLSAKYDISDVKKVKKEDSISRLIRYDELLIQHGNKLYLKYKVKYNHKMIRAKLRLLGRLLYEMKKINVLVTNFSRKYTPELYDSFVATVNLFRELSSDGTKYNKPALPSAIGIEIKKVARLLIANCIRQKNENSKKMAKYFLELFIEDYSGSLSKTVAESQNALKRKKVTTLPIMDDIKVLNLYIKQQRIPTTYSNLIENYSSSNWKELAPLTLISLLLLNRRRSGELERTLLTDLRNYQTVSEDQNFELYEGFTTSGRVSARNYGRITIRGKLCIELSVLIPEQEYRCLQLIVKFRKRAGVPMSNPYLFGLPSVLKSQQRYLRACNLLRKYSLQCSAKHPSRLRATLLRKHIATRSAVKGFNESEVSDLANYLGHADKIHRDNYRMPLRKTRMSAVLEEARCNIQKVADISCSSVNASIFEESRCCSSDILSDSKDISWDK